MRFSRCAPMACHSANRSTSPFRNTLICGRKGDEPIPVIVVQAELGKGLKIFGVRDLKGKGATAKDSELELLGTHPPD